MPPIDPRLLPPSATQPPPPQPTSATPVQSPYSYGGSFMPPTITSLPPRMAQQQSDAQAQAAHNAAMAPSQEAKSKTEAEIALVTLRKLRIEQGLDPDTGKPDVNSGKIGPLAIADLPEEKQNIVKAIVTGRFPISQYSISRNPEIMDLVKTAYRYEPGTDLTTFQKRSAAFQKFQSDPKSPVIRLNTALSHLDLFYKAAVDLNNFHTGAKSLWMSLPANLAHEAEMRFNQDPRVTALDVAKNKLSTELAAAFKGYDPALQQVQEELKLLNAHSSPEQYAKVAQETAKFLGSRIDAQDYAFQQTLGPNSSGLARSLMSPEARDQFDRYSAEDFGVNTPIGDKQISATEKQITIPEGYQTAYANKMSEIPRGELTPEKYIQIRQDLDKQYLPEGESSHLVPKEVQDFVDGYNKGEKLGKVPALNVKLSDEGIIPGTHAFSEKDRAIAAASPLGTFIAAGANAGTGGLVDEAIGQEGREAKALNEQNNWKSAMAGDIFGSIAPITGLERGAAKSIQALAKQFKVAPETMKAIMESNRIRVAGNTAANTVYGGVRGFNNANEGEGGTGFLRGAAGGFVAAPIAGVLAEGVNRGLPLLSQPTLDALAKMKGVKLTTLQKLGLGRGEETFHGVPGIRGARGKAIESYNIANANNALDPIGVKVPAGVKAGSALNSYIGKQANAAYEAVKPNINGMVDKPFTDAVDALKSQATTPEKLAMWQEIKDASNLLKADKSGNFNGDSYKEASARFRYLINKWTHDDASVGAGDWAHEAMGIKKEMQNLLQRQLPPDVYSNLKNVETTWARRMEIVDASNRAKNTGRVYSPNQMMATHGKFDTSSGKTRSAENKMPGQNFTQAAQDIIGGEQVPTRNALRDTLITLGGGATLGGIGAVSPAAGGILAGVGAAAYAPLIKQLTQIALTKRGTGTGTDITRRALEDYFRKRMTGD